MKAMWLAFLSIALIAVGANLVLRQAGFSSEQVGSGPDVRLN